MDLASEFGPFYITILSNLDDVAPDSSAVLIYRLQKFAVQSKCSHASEQ